jgi:hypothetical protein
MGQKCQLYVLGWQRRSWTLPTTDKVLLQPQVETYFKITMTPHADTWYQLSLRGRKRSYREVVEATASGIDLPEPPMQTSVIRRHIPLGVHIDDRYLNGVLLPGQLLMMDWPDGEMTVELEYIEREMGV